MMKLFLKIILLLLLVISCDRILSRVLRHGLDLYYGLDQARDVLFIGNSHTEVGIDSRLLARLTGLSTAVYGVSGTGILEHEHMIRQYLHRYQPPKIIVLGVDGRIFVHEKLWETAYLNFYPYIDDAVIDEYVKRQCDSWREYYVRRYLALMRFGDIRNLVIRGFFDRPKNYDWSWDANQSLVKGVDGSIVGPSIDVDKVKILRNIIQLTNESNIKLIVLHIPGTDIDTHNYLYQFLETDKILKRISSDANVEYDTEMEYLSKERDKFFDPDHLNSSGKNIFTTHIAHKLLSYGLKRNKRLE